MTRLLLLVLPGGAFVYAAVLALSCRHPHEVLHFAGDPCVGTKMARVSPSGNAGGPEANGEVRTHAMLYCPDCRRLRPHPWAGDPVRYHRTQAPKPEPLTGVERIQAEAREELEAPRRAFRVYEIQCASERVREKVGWRA